MALRGSLCPFKRHLPHVWAVCPMLSLLSISLGPVQPITSSVPFPYVRLLRGTPGTRSEECVTDNKGSTKPKKKRKKKQASLLRFAELTAQMVKMLMDDEPSLLNGPFIYVMWMLSSAVLTALSSGSSIRGMLTHSNETQTA